MSDITAAPPTLVRTRTTGIQIVVLAAASLGLLILTALTASSLYFVWEEWGHLWDAVESPLWGLLQSHFGYVSPLGRLLFLIEAKAFGHWYAGYALVNALLLIVVVGVMWRTLRPPSSWASWALTGGLITFLFSGGALFAVNFAAMDAYFLCWLFGVLALAAWRAHRHSAIVLVLLLAAALSSTLMNVVVTTFVVSMMIGLGRPGSPTALRWQSWRGPFGYAIFSASVSLVMFLVGRAFPSVDPMVGVGQSVAPEVTADPIGQLLPLAALLAVWLASPFLGVIAVSQDLFERAVILLIDRPVLVVIVLAVVVTLLVLAGSRRIGGVGWQRTALTVVLLSSALLFAVQIVIFRGGQIFEVRYTLMWLPAVVVFWSWWIHDVTAANARTPIASALRGLARTGAVIMIIVGIGVAAISPVLVDQAVDLIRPRTEASLELKEAVVQCGTIDAPDVAGILAPGMPWEGVCDAATFVRD